MKTGRPKKYSTKKALEDAIEKYFHSISRTIELRGMDGEVILNDDGDAIRKVQFVLPPSISGLCIHLGIDRSTWNNYCDEEQHPEFRGVTAMTRARIEAWLEEQLLTREKGVQGIIFNLQNNYGWRQKQEVELGEKTRKTVQEEGLSLQDKLAAIAQAKESIGVLPEYRGDGEDD